MAMLSQQDLQEEVTNGMIDPASVPFAKVRFQPSSIDLHLNSVLVYNDNDHEVKRECEDHPFLLRPGQMVTFVSQEIIKMPRSLGAMVLLPNTVAQRGILAFNATHVDPGFHGRLNLRILNLSGRPYTVIPGMAFATLLVFGLTHSAAEGFERNVDDDQYFRDVETIVLEAGGASYAPQREQVEQAVNAILPEIIWGSAPFWGILGMTFLLLVVTVIQLVRG